LVPKSYPDPLSAIKRVGSRIFEHQLGPKIDTTTLIFWHFFSDGNEGGLLREDKPEPATKCSVFSNNKVLYMGACKTVLWNRNRNFFALKEPEPECIQDPDAVLVPEPDLDPDPT
jgi:hypothetical protein